MVEAKAFYRTDFLSDQALYNYLRNSFCKYGPFSPIKFAFNFTSLILDLSARIAKDVHMGRYEQLTRGMKEDFSYFEAVFCLKRELKETLPSRLEKFVLEGKLEASDFRNFDAILINDGYNCFSGPWYTLPDRI